MDGLSLKSEKIAIMRGDLSDCCMLYGGRASRNYIVEVGSSLASRNQKSS